MQNCKMRLQDRTKKQIAFCSADSLFKKWGGTEEDVSGLNDIFAGKFLY